MWLFLFPALLHKPEGGIKNDPDFSAKDTGRCWHQVRKEMHPNMNFNNILLLV